MTAPGTTDPQFPARELLEFLADGELHSGQDLADKLGVSRTAIWKQLAKIESLGLNLQSHKGKGYRLVGGIDFLEKEKILKYLFSGVSELIETFDIFNNIDSTNAYLLHQDASEKIKICIAECQTAGRGRRGRNWVSPFAKNIYLSLKVTLENGLNAAEGLSLAIGVGIVRALKTIGVPDIKLKWPNDLMWGNRKVGGVLIEVTGEPSGHCHLVIGIGLNLFSDQSMEGAISQPWVSLNEIYNLCLDRNKIVAMLLNELLPLLKKYEELGFAAYQNEWNSLNIHEEKTVDILLGNSVKTGVMKGVTHSGALILQTINGEEIIHGGEVSLRGSQ